MSAMRKKQTTNLRPFLTGGKLKSTAAPSKPEINPGIKRSRATSTGRLGSSRVKKSEYSRQYQQYDLEDQAANRPQTYKPRQTLGQIGRMQGEGAATWRSVQQNDFGQMYDEDEFDPAGKATANSGDMRQSLNVDAGWQQMDLQGEKENILNAAADPRTASGISGWQNANARTDGKLSTEQSRQFYWKPLDASQRAQSAKPSQRTAPILSDDFGQNPADHYASEYQKQTQRLREQQAALMRPAGKASLTHLPNPTFYAYEGADADDEEPRPRLNLQPSGPGRGPTEYKHKYKEWPIMDKVETVKPKVNIDNQWLQQADPEGLYAAPDNHRRTSKIKEDYPIHDPQFVSQQKEEADYMATARRQSSNVNPPSFAWKLQDPYAAGEEILDEEDEKVKKNRVKNLRWKDNASEYTEQYGNIIEDGYKASKVPPRPDTLNLFEGKDSNRGVLSEYVDKYREQELQRALSEARFVGDEGFVRPTDAAKKMKVMQDAQYPAQFAWDTNDEEAAVTPEYESPRWRSPLTVEQTEYSSKYPWPPRTDGNKPAVPPKGSDDVLGIDVEDDNAFAWRSEYNSANTALPNPSTGYSAPIAGVPSATNPKAPPNFAWVDFPIPPPPQPSSPTRERALPDQEKVISEQRESFVRWPIESNVPPIRHTNDESASNIYTLPSSDGEPSNVLSEYDDRYTYHNVNSHGSTTDAANRIKRRADQIPKQFAWRLIDPYKEPVPPPPNPRHIPFTARSEYETNFTPKPVEDAYQRVYNPYERSKDVIVPVGGVSESEPSAFDQDKEIPESGFHHGASPDMPIAGVKTHADGAGAPPFYAWSAVPGNESEPVLPIVEVPKYKGEHVDSEYAEKFGAAVKSIESGNTTPSMHARPRRHSYDLISGLNSDDPAEHYPSNMSSEYDDQYHSFTSRQIEHLHDSDVGPPGKRSHRPPNFAWSLIEPKDSKPFDAPVSRAAARPSTSLQPKGKQSTRVGIEEDEYGPSQWKSEYDDSCTRLIELQNKSSVAGLKSSDLSKGPAVFRGRDKKSPLIGSATSPFDGTATTEYREKFTHLPLERQSKSRFSETYKHLGFVPKNHFSGVSEYDANFVPPDACAELNEHVNKNYPNPTEYQRKFSWRDATPREIDGDTAPKPKFQGRSDPEVRKEDDRPAHHVLHDHRKDINMGKRTIPRDGGVTPSFPGREVRKQVGTFGTAKRNLQKDPSPEPTPRYRFKQSESVGGNSMADSAGFDTGAKETGEYGSTSSTINRVDRPGEAVWHPSLQRSLRAEGDFQNTTEPEKDFSRTEGPSTPQYSTTSRTQDSSPRGFGRKTSLIADFAGGDRQSKFRSRSTPPRTNLSQTYQPRTKAYVDETASNPVLMNKRYPYVSMKQMGRWTSEAHDKYRWSKT